MAAERNRRAMEQLAKLDGNDRCAECRRESKCAAIRNEKGNNNDRPFRADPDWVAIVQNLSLAVFVCTECCGSHRAPGRTYVRTKSIQLDKFDDDEVQVR